MNQSIKRIVALASLIIPDKPFLSLRYRLTMGKVMNWENPITFGEKIQWLKVFDRKPEYTTMVDKYAVKDYVKDIIGEQYVIPTYGVWNKPDEIDWKMLPNKFVIKTTNDGDGNGVIICRNKDTFDRKAATQRLCKSLKYNLYAAGREWPYKNVPHRIIAEELLETPPGMVDVPDYKWYCFNGVPKFCQVILNRHIKETIDFFDSDWNHQMFTGLTLGIYEADTPPPRPKHLETQLMIARELSRNIPFVRIDLFETKDRVYFGEITFYPNSGYGSFRPDNYNMIIGNMLELPKKDV